jgi:hypothetical protein
MVESEGVNFFIVISLKSCQKYSVLNASVTLAARFVTHSTNVGLVKAD